MMLTFIVCVQVEELPAKAEIQAALHQAVAAALQPKVENDTQKKQLNGKLPARDEEGNLLPGFVTEARLDKVGCISCFHAQIACMSIMQHASHRTLRST
jgi:hypothetical protein